MDFDLRLFFHITIFFFLNKGLGCKYIYQKNGDPLHVSELLESFKKDARSFKLRAGKHQLEDVTDVLKSFLSDTDDALLTKELYPYWISALGNIYINMDHHKCLPFNGITRFLKSLIIWKFNWTEQCTYDSDKKLCKYQYLVISIAEEICSNHWYVMCHIFSFSSFLSAYSART